MEGLKTPRKSCDFCYLRKIKCDRQKPRCSQCITSTMDCTYTAPSRKPGPKKPRNSARIEDGINNTQGRLQHLESLVEQLTKRLEVSEKKNESRAQTQLQMASPIASVKLSTTTSEARYREHTSNSPRSMTLPPLQQVLPVVKIFLREFNAVLPLFHAETLLRLVHDFYNLGPQQRDPVAWAAINVVLALAHRHTLSGSSNVYSSVEYLSRAESVLSTVVLGDIQLLNIQVLVGMVILIRASQDLQPSLILIATTMRLAHRIGLHNSASSAELDPIEARQRACVFWMAYILDKDLSMHSKQPSIQIDDDIDLYLPLPQVPEHQIDDTSEIDGTDMGSGIVTTIDETVKMNYFVTRIQLAIIEGGVYDYLYSTRSQKRTPAERSRALESLVCALEQWKASIPLEFSTSECLRRVSPGVLRFLCVLHSTSLACTTLINQAHAWNAEWISSLRRYGREGVTPLFPSQWELLVDEARDLLVLFEALGTTDRWNFWITGCSYMTAMVLLAANAMDRPRHNKLSSDTQLVEAGLRTVNKMVEETDCERLRSFRAMCTELNQEIQRRHIEAIMMAKNLDSASFFLDTQYGFEGNG